jgi:hypothetical protein
MKKLLILFAPWISGCWLGNPSTVNSHGTQLMQIAYTGDNEKWTKQYFYDTDARLIMIEDNRSTGRRVEITYSGERLIQYVTYRLDDNTLIFRDSILYAAGGLPEKQLHFSINAGPDLPFSWVYEFTYDDHGRLFKRSSYSVRAGKYTSHNTYFWDGDNVERMEYRDAQEELLYEYFYTYDDNPNYLKNIPVYNPGALSANNAVMTQAIDHYGNLDLICNPCEVKYRYNRDGYPVEAKFKHGVRMLLTYE